MHFVPCNQLPLNLEGIDIDGTNGRAAVANPAEFESSQTMPLGLADKPSFFQCLLSGNLVWSQTSDGIALWDDPAAAAPRRHQANINTASRIDEKRQCPDLMLVAA